jgi:hypothetical protein
MMFNDTPKKTRKLEGLLTALYNTDWIGYDSHSCAVHQWQDCGHGTD